MTEIVTADVPERTGRGPDQRQRVRRAGMALRAWQDFSWHDDAKCATDPRADWFTSPLPPGRDATLRRLRKEYLSAVCNGCPVFKLCDEQARSTHPSGVWMANRYYGNSPGITDDDA